MTDVQLGLLYPAGFLTSRTSTGKVDWSVTPSAAYETSICDNKLEIGDGDSNTIGTFYVPVLPPTPEPGLPYEYRGVVRGTVHVTDTLGGSTQVADVVVDVRPSPSVTVVEVISWDTDITITADFILNSTTWSKLCISAANGSQNHYIFQFFGQAAITCVPGNNPN